MSLNYEIIATLGPASSSPALWPVMMASGATAFRLNTSHLTLPQTLDWIERLQAVLIPGGNMPPVVLDLQGSKWRLGSIPSLNLEAGQTIHLVFAARTDLPETLDRKSVV